MVSSGVISSGIISGGLDTDAQAFIDAAGITNIQQRYAINKLVLQAKGHGWWNKCNAIYPMVGGTAASHKFNLKDPRDLDAAFRLSFQGTWTHSATGALPDGSTAYADTFMSASAVLTNNDTHLSYYSRTNVNNGTNATELGSSGGPGTIQILIRVSDAFGVSMYQAFGSEFLTGSNTNSACYFMGSRTSSTSLAAYKNGALVGSNTLPVAGSLSTAKIYLAALSNGNTPQNFCPRECAFATIGAGIDSTLAAIMYGDIQDFQVRLNRAIF
jgi:hypothetical protein